jgi:subtilisin
VDPCTGITGCTAGTRDFFGNAIPNGAYDIGANEYGGAPVPTPTPGGPTATPVPPTATPTPGAGSVMHVSNIAMSFTKSGTNYTAKATVTIVDANNAPVSGATVYGQFTGATSNSVSGTTDANGQVTLSSTAKKNGGTWQFCVTNVTKSGWTYNSSANVETCDTITAP